MAIPCNSTRCEMQLAQGGQKQCCLARSHMATDAYQLALHKPLTFISQCHLNLKQYCKVVIHTTVFMCSLHLVNLNSHLHVSTFHTHVKFLLWLLPSLLLLFMWPICFQCLPQLQHFSCGTQSICQSAANKWKKLKCINLG